MSRFTCVFAFVIVVVALMLNGAHGAKILGIFNVPTFSHYNLGNRLLEELAQKGHEVTMISPFGKDASSMKNYHNVHVDGLHDYIEKFKENMTTNSEDMANMSPYVSYILCQEFGYHLTEFTLKNSNVQKLIASKPHFDAVIIEQFFNDGLKAFCHHFSAPCIAFSTIGSNHMVNNLVANPSPYSYVVDIFLPYTPSMSMLERLDNFIFQTYATLTSCLYYDRRHETIMQETFPQAPSLKELKSNIALVLLNSHVSTNQPAPHVPNMIEIGGYHVKAPKALPADLQKFLDSATNGAIYVSFGSHVRSADLPAEKRKALMAVFAGLKQKVLWKFEDDALPDKPANVLISKWFPQSDILAHKNIKLFITHGGLLSTLEAVVRGVPLVGVPFLGDQKLNMARTVQNGFGLHINFEDLTEAKLREAVQKILSDDSFSKNAKKRSALMADRPLTPAQTAIYWIEYVIRYNGADFLRVTGVDLPWYKYYMVDVMVVIAMILFVVKILFSKICSGFCGGSKAKKQQQQNKKVKKS